MKLAVLIPAFNEERTIREVIEGIPEKIDGISRIIKIVIDDASTDRTVEIAKESGAEVVSHRNNMGVGSAFRTGLRAALSERADVIVNIDGDGQFNPADIPLLLQPILNKQADFVSASRFIDKKLTPKMPFMRKWGNRQMSRIVSFFTGQKFYDVSCGFRAYSKDTAMRLNLFGNFTYTQETFLNLAFKNITIAEVPVVVKGSREHGKSNISTDLFSYAWRTMRIILKTFRDYNPMRFFGLISGICITSGVLLGLFLIIHYIRTGGFVPHKWAGFTGGFLFGIGLLVFIVGLIADMLDRIRSYQEEILYNQKKDYHNGK